MSKESSPGLLSKVVKFVRNPTVHWSDLEQSELDQDSSSYSKQMLKEMIERKRRNDFVRRREFDHLRKLRRREALSGPVQGQSPSQDSDTGRPSFFQSSMASRPDDRAVTLKKIDEIEAQMSMQWWKTKQGVSATQPDTQPQSIPPSSHLPLESAPGAPLTAPLSDLGAYATTVAASVPPLFGASVPPPPPLSPDEALSIAMERPEEPQDDEPEIPRAPEVPAFVHDPELEEAAIRFANGDVDGAEASLLEVIAARDDVSAEDVWLTLFDLYRATGRHESFDVRAIDFAGRFGRSAPLWFSLPDLLGQAPSLPAGDAAAPAKALHWRAPSLLAVSSIASLRALLARAAPPWTLNWSGLTALEPAAVPMLADLVASWSGQPIRLQFIDVATLVSLLEAHTPSGDATVDKEWWRLRMELLRIMGRADEFDLVALDFCVTYEVSPPSWQAVRCACMLLADGTDPHASAPDAVLLEDESLAGLPGGGAMPGAGGAELSGQILGDAGAALSRWDESTQPGRTLSIACGKLARVDFSAAGSVLNWAAARQADGVQVQFHRLHRLVAIFFNVIGINEYAKVVPRAN